MTPTGRVAPEGREATLEELPQEAPARLAPSFPHPPGGSGSLPPLLPKYPEKGPASLPTGLDLSRAGTP